MFIEEGLSVKEVLQIDPLITSNLIAGNEGTKKIIKTVNILADIEGIDWVEEGEMLLATTLALNLSVSFKKKLIKILDMKGLSALAIKKCGENTIIDSCIIEDANRYGFSLIELDPTVPFSKIVTAINSSILNKRSLISTKLEEFDNELIKIMSRGGGLKQIVSNIYNVIGNPILIHDKMLGRFEGEDGTQDQLIINGNLKSIVNMECNLISNNGSQYFKNSEKIEGKIVTRFTSQIHTSYGIHGYIYIWELNKPLSNIDIRILETALNVIALELMNKMLLYQVENRHKNEFLENLISQDTQLQNLAFSKGPTFGWNPNDGYVVMAINLNVKEVSENDNNTVLNDKFSSYKDWIIQEISIMAITDNNKIIVGQKNDCIILLVCVEDKFEMNFSSIKCRKIADKIIKVIDNKCYNTLISIGIGRYYNDNRKLWRSYNEARSALTFGKSEFKKRIFNFEKMGIYKFLSNESISDDLVEFYNDTLKLLVEYDKKKNTEFIPTLEAYFKTGGNIKNMAKLLYVHYNTVSYRIQRIQEMVNIDLKSPENRFDIEIGLKIMKILDKK